MKIQDTSLKVSIQDIEKFEKFLYERESAATTISKYKTDLKTFFCFLGEETVIDKVKLLSYKEWLLSRYKINSVNSILAALNQFLIFMDAEQLRVKRIKMQRNFFIQEDKEMTVREFKRLVYIARSEGREQLALCMETIASTGIRISELRYFTLERVLQGRIEIYNKGKLRKIFIPEAVRVKLLQFCREKEITDGYIFATKSGRAKDRSNIWKEMKNLQSRSGIDKNKIFPHNLRHLFARQYYQSTKDLTGLADLLGHSSLNVTRVYTACTGKRYQKQLDQVALDFKI
ncbi:MAG: tyrosine-type recombinase/integrase [Catenibacillus sp.]